MCRESRASQGAKGRIFEPEEVARRNPEGVIASWCGRKAKREKIASRPGWAEVRAVVESVSSLAEVRARLADLLSRDAA